MVYQKTVKGHEIYAFTQEVMLQDGNTSNFVGGHFLSLFTIDDPPGALGGQCLKDDEGSNRLFTIPMDAITAAFLAAEATLP